MMAILQFKERIGAKGSDLHIYKKELDVSFW